VSVEGERAVKPTPPHNSSTPEAATREEVSVDKRAAENHHLPIPQHLELLLLGRSSRRRGEL
jgi:hypothetical protein